jgi:hypothetical protein
MSANAHGVLLAWQYLTFYILCYWAAAAGEDLAVINGVCHTANSIFKRYRNQFSSDKLVAELAASQVRQQGRGTGRGGNAWLLFLQGHAMQQQYLLHVHAMCRGATMVKQWPAGALWWAAGHKAGGHMVPRIC